MTKIIPFTFGWLLLLPAVLQAQCPPPQQLNTNYQMRAVGYDSALRVCKNRPHLTCWLDSGALQYNVFDSSYYEWTGTQWIPFRSKAAGASPAPPVFSVQWNKDGTHFGGDGTFSYDTTHHVETVDTATIRKQNFRADSAQLVKVKMATIDGPGFFYSIEDDFVNPDGLHDNVLGYAMWNMIQDGVPVDPHKGGFGEFTESHFFNAGSYQMEHHIVATDTFGRNYRLMSMQTNEADGVTHLFFTNEMTQFFPKNDPNHPWLESDDAGNLRTRGHNWDFALVDSVPTWGQFGISNAVDGSVNMSNQSSGSNNVISISSGVQLVGSTANVSMKIEPPNVANGIALLVQNTGTVTGDFNARDENFDATGFLIDGSTNLDAAGSNALFRRHTGPTGAAYLQVGCNGTNQFQFNIGDHAFDSTIRYCMNNGGLITSGQIMVMGMSNLNVGIGANTYPDPTAALDVNSTTRGFLPPRMTTTQKLAIASPTEGLQVYDLTLHQMSYWNGTTWINF